MPKARPAPLAGRRIVVTRAADQTAGLIAALAAAGAQTVALPTIAIVPPSDREPLERAARAAAAGGYDGFIFTSRNGVEAFFAAARALRTRLPKPAAWICAIGPATAQSLAECGWAPDVVPSEFVAESAVAALQGRELAGKRILLPRAAEARPVIPQALTARGALVDVVEAYRTVVPEGIEARARQLFPAAAEQPRPDTALFTSSSTVRHLAALLGSDYRERLRGVLLAAIGPVTAGTLEAWGLAAGLVATEFTTAGLVAALIAHAGQRPPPEPGPG